MTLTPGEASRRLGDTYAAALLFWPAVIAALEVPPDTRWGLALRVLLWAWAGLFALAASFGRRPAGPQFGLALTLGAAALALFWSLDGVAPRLAALAATILCFHAAERARLAEPPSRERLARIAGGEDVHAAAPRPSKGLCDEAGRQMPWTVARPLLTAREEQIAREPSAARIGRSRRSAQTRGSARRDWPALRDEPRWIKKRGRAYILTGEGEAALDGQNRWDKSVGRVHRHGRAAA